jgi:CheY-like chemotaxis protein
MLVVPGRSLRASSAKPLLDLFTSSDDGMRKPRMPKPKSLTPVVTDQKMTTSTESDTVAPETESGSRARVLLAEDDRALRRFLEVVLERAGYKVIPAADGLEAMKLALSTPIDIVVTDAMMPNLSGHEFCRFLRNSQTLSSIPVILLSALERKEPKLNGEQVDAFLAKPVSGESLVECIEKLLARKRD